MVLAVGLHFVQFIEGLVRDTHESFKSTCQFVFHNIVWLHESLTKTSLLKHGQRDLECKTILYKMGSSNATNLH